MAGIVVAHFRQLIQIKTTLYLISIEVCWQLAHKDKYEAGLQNIYVKMAIAILHILWIHKIVRQ